MTRRSAAPCVLSLALLALTACATKRLIEYMPPTDGLAEPGEGTAVVRFMQPYYGGQTVPVLDGDRVVGISWVGKLFDCVVEPGEHVFSLATDVPAYLEAELEPGKTYYVLVYPRADGYRVPFLPLPRGADWYGLVTGWEEALERHTPDAEALGRWQELNQQKLDGYRSDHETRKMDPRYRTRLRPEDGR